MRRWLVWTGVVAAGVAAVLWATVLAPKPIPVKVVAVTRGRVESTVTNTKAGTVRARRRAALSPQVGGEVVEVTHREGEAVKRGDVLVRLDDKTERAQLQLAQESARAAEALQQQSCIQRDRAQRELARKRELAAEHIVSVDLLDSLQSAYDAANASCNAAAAEAGRARAQIDAIAVELDKLVLHAPFDGVLAEVDVEVGEWITPSPPLIPVPAALDIIDPTSLYVSAPMDEVDSAAIHTGQRASISVDSRPGEHFAGRVVRVAPYVLDVEAQNRTVEIEVELDDAAVSSQLLPGTSADVEVVLDAREGVLRVPTPALLEGDHVLVASDGRLAERRVEVGLKNWDWAEVQGGLAEGDRVVTTLDRSDVVAGARVRAEETEYRP
jgi:HlyD family secretion protein